MAENKKSFILYSDLLSVVEKLVLKDRENKTNFGGELFLHILKYVNDKEPVAIDFIVEMAFEPIKLSLKRDLEKYNRYIEKQRVNGAKGGRPKKPKETQPFLEKPKKADSVSVSDSVNDIYYKKSLDDLVWIESIARNLKINVSQVNNYLKDFKTHLELTKDKKESCLKYQQHFVNWLKTKNPKKSIIAQENPYKGQF
jgi:hypothetical protein